MLSIPSSSLSLPDLSMPYISTEALVGAALLIVLALGYQYLPNAPGSAGSKASKKKGKKKSKSTQIEETRPEPPVKPAAKGERKPSGSGDSRAAPPLEKQVSGGESASDRAEHGATFFTAITGGYQGAKPKTLAEKLAPKPRKSKVDG